MTEVFPISGELYKRNHTSNWKAWKMIQRWCSPSINVGAKVIRIPGSGLKHEFHVAWKCVELIGSEDSIEKPWPKKPNISPSKGPFIHKGRACLRTTGFFRGHGEFSGLYVHVWLGDPYVSVHFFHLLGVLAALNIVTGFSWLWGSSCAHVMQAFCVQQANYLFRWCFFFIFF